MFECGYVGLTKSHKNLPCESLKITAHLAMKLSGCPWKLVEFILEIPLARAFKLCMILTYVELNTYITTFCGFDIMDGFQVLWESEG